MSSLETRDYNISQYRELQQSRVLLQVAARRVWFTVALCLYMRVPRVGKHRPIEETFYSLTVGSKTIYHARELNAAKSFR
jgi:hypothetical protein